MTTGVVTPFKAGETITIQLQETIPHPGHYRVALAVNNRSELPADPPVTPDSRSPCGTTVIQNPPVFPVLADGELRHTTPLTGMQTIRVKLPDNVTCTKCTLQIIEFMSDHELNNPGGCYYHHCADISISPATGTGGAGGTGTAGGSGTGGASAGRGGTSGSTGAGASGGASGGTGGGSFGTGGNAGASGNAGAGGNAGGVGGASGGAAGTDAGTSGGASGMGTGASNPAGPATEDGSCTCSVPGQRREALGFAGLAFVLLGFAWRRRGR
jgi:hypothetical protein